MPPKYNERGAFTVTIARDKFWIFGVRPHQDDIWLGKRDEDRNYKRSRITPAEAALMLDVPNVMMIICDGEPAPFSEDAYGYAESFCRLNKVLWGSTGSCGFRAGNEEQFICELAEKYPNISGAFMDDFFGKFRGSPDAAKQANALLKEIRAGLDKAPRRMDLYTVGYTHEYDEMEPGLMEYIDGISLWTWNCEELPLLESRFEAIEKKLPKQKKLLGIYMFDFPSGMPVPLKLMEHQCELGLRLMKEGRLDGMIFETNSVMGVGLPSEKWLREWLETAKYTEIPER